MNPWATAVGGGLLGEGPGAAGASRDPQCIQGDTAPMIRGIRARPRIACATPPGRPRWGLPTAYPIYTANGIAAHCICRAFGHRTDVLEGGRLVADLHVQV